MSSAMSSATMPLSTQEYLAQQLLNPSNLAIAASLGIHGLILGLALPSFSSWSKENQPPVTAPVNVVELTEVEQARLPDLSPTATQAPDLGVANTSALDAPPLASSFPSNFDSLPPPPSLPSLPSLPPLSFNNRIPVAIAPRALPPSIPFRTLPAPPPPYLPQFSQPSGNRGNQPKFDPPRDAINPDELINRKPNLDAPSGQSPLAATSIPPALEASLQRDDANTSNEEAMRNNVDWMAKNRIGQRPQSLEIAGIYPPAACLKQIEGSAVYGVSVTPQGTIEPSLIQSSGYQLLNQQAARDLGSAIPKQAGYYRVTVNYKYRPQVCPAVPATAPQTAVPRQPVLPANPAPTNAIRQAPTTPGQPAATPTAPASQPPQATPEVRRQAPATPQTQSPATAVQPPNPAPSPAVSPSPESTPEALKPAKPLGEIAPRKN